MTDWAGRAEEFEDDWQEVRGALLGDPIPPLGPAEPICLAPTATVEEAIARMLERRQACVLVVDGDGRLTGIDRKSTRLNSSHLVISYAVFCLKKKKKNRDHRVS